MLCVYHGDCADGFGAAWVVKKALGPEVGFFPGVYQEAPPAIGEGEDLILVDFSYPRHVLLELAGKARSILILDHHKSAQAELMGLPPNVEAVFDMERSGVMLAWDYFYPGDEQPELFCHIQDQDLWRFELEGTREIVAALYSYPMEFGEWDRLLTTPVASLRMEGACLARSRKKEIEGHLRRCATRGVIAGHDVPMVNAPLGWASDAGAILACGERFAAVYCDTPSGRNFSLRSSNDGGMDVSVIAGRFGGGGHEHAAGFTLPHDELHKLATGIKPCLATASSH
ncbi:MAG: phosphohydrolase [Gammaproteobacteria bacterium]|nr:phosphohydrolase [Gammaproteobacteria bacterium]MBU1655187.1 phosphohydrolase [Gammaproteobacteria bacterium]MBU1959998.1 phosphohydrolase [Gammaproteobacteria bacterium]